MFRPDANREIQDENTQQIGEDEDEDKSNPEEDTNQGGGIELDDMQHEVKKITHPQVRGSRIRHELKTNLNSEYFTPKHATRRSTDNQQINISEDEEIESVYNAATISDPNTSSNIKEVLRGNEKEA